MANTNSLMLQDMGLTAINGIAGMLMSAEERRMQKIQRDYENAMAALSAAQSQNQLTRNEAAIKDQLAFAEAADQTAVMLAEEETRASAAAAGVSGNSVGMSLYGHTRGAAQKAMAKTLEARQALSGINDQRRQVEINKAYGKRIDIMPNTMASDLLGLGTKLLDTYRAYQPSTYMDAGA